MKISTRSASNATANKAADVSDPPRPKVVTCPSSDIPWNPETTTTSWEAKASNTASVFTSKALAF